MSSTVEPSSTFETVAIERSRWMPARIAEDEGAAGPFSIELYLKYYRIRNRAAMLPKEAIDQHDRALAELQSKLSKIMLQRSQNDIHNSSLPEKTTYVIGCDMTQPQRAAYNYEANRLLW